MSSRASSSRWSADGVGNLEVARPPGARDRARVGDGDDAAARIAAIAGQVRAARPGAGAEHADANEVSVGHRPDRIALILEPVAARTDPPYIVAAGDAHGTDGLHQGRADRHHRVDRRLARHAVVPLSRRGQGNQERRAAHRPRVAGRAVRLPRAVRRPVRPGQAHADDRQHPDPHDAQGLEVRLRVAVQGRRLLRHHAAVHRQQVGHVEPGDDARPGLRHRPAARLRHLRLPHRRRRRGS